MPLGHGHVRAVSSHKAVLPTRLKKQLHGLHRSQCTLCQKERYVNHGSSVLTRGVKLLPVPDAKPPHHAF